MDVKVVLGWILSLVLAFFAGEWRESTRNDKLETAITTGVVAADGTAKNSVGVINQQAKESNDGQDIKLQVGVDKANIDYLNLLKLSTPRVSVSTCTKVTDTASSGTEPDSGGNFETYRAELSPEAFQFFTGEARRAEQCAVRLGDAQTRLVNVYNQVKAYNKVLEATYGSKGIVLDKK